MAPHVGLNCVFLVPGETGGMETYARELARELAALGVRLTAFVNLELAEERPEALPDEVDRVVVPVRARSRVQWVRGEQQLLPGLAARAGVDVLHSLASTAPARGRFRRVVTVHDLHYAVAKEAHFGIYGLGLRLLVPLAVRRSHRVIAVSESTARDLERLLGVDRSRVDVVHQGVLAPPGRAKPAPGRDALAPAAARLGIPPGRRLVLCLSAKRPHKNLAGLLRALALIEPAQRPVCLLPGYPTPHEGELRELAAQLGIAADVRFAGWLPAEDVEAAWALADAFVFPSVYEGFGLPVLEAMARGVPVACADRASLPEVAGDAALLFDPRDPASIAAAVRRVLGDTELRERLAAAGPERAAQFTWERTARRTLQAYERAMGPA